MTIFGQNKEKLKGIGGKKDWLKFRKNYEDLERFTQNLKNLNKEWIFISFHFSGKTPLLR